MDVNINNLRGCNRKPPQENYNELEETFEKLKCQNSETKNMITSLRDENLALEKQYNDYKQRLSDLTELLQKNVQVFYQLFDDTNNALQIGRNSMVNSPVVRNKCFTRTSNLKPRSSTVSFLENMNAFNDESSQIISSSPPIAVVPKRSLKNDAEPGSSRDSSATDFNSRNRQYRNIVTRKIPIHPINLKELRESCENAENILDSSGEHSVDNVEAEDNIAFGASLSTIREENSSILNTQKNHSVSFINTLTLTTTVTEIPPSICNNTQRPYIRLSRLPADVVDYHLRKRNNYLDASKSLNVTDSLFENEAPRFSSTPLKLETMKMLGLVPTPSAANCDFVTMRREENGNKNNKRISSPFVSPKKKETSINQKGVLQLKKESISPYKENFSGTLRRRSSRTFKKSQSEPKKRKASPDAKPAGSGRALRKARPQALKEESLKVKKRRT